MGFYMHQVDARFFIPEKNVKKALKAVKKLKRAGGYSWVSEDFYLKNSLPTILAEWRWAVETDDDGNITHIAFEGEKLGDEVTLFNALAPFVKAGSYIEMHGDEETMWRWVFENGEMIEKNPTVTWD